MENRKRDICEKCGAKYVLVGEGNKCNHTCPSRRTKDYNHMSDETKKAVARMKEELAASRTSSSDLLLTGCRCGDPMCAQLRAKYPGTSGYVCPSQLQGAGR